MGRHIIDSERILGGGRRKVRLAAQVPTTLMGAALRMSGVGIADCTQASGRVCADMGGSLGKASG